ncbi:hypothetical protein CDAR_402351 [Caerostris darwini]|uniref:Uncharacterized protein n=1 Tax=Caerostris darwini TaxID=1538125 RepID=A0AAV4R683_9ARAC|nr:hypothetical protein CDAR_402351 [Caerostris darwini]
MQWLIQWQKHTCKISSLFFPISFPGERMGYESARKKEVLVKGVSHRLLLLDNHSAKRKKHVQRAIIAETHVRAEIEVYYTHITRLDVSCQPVSQFIETFPLY